MLLFYYSLLVISIADCEAVGQSFKFHTDPAFDDIMCSLNNVAFATTVEGKIHCAKLCSENQGCDAVIFYHGNKTCFGLTSAKPFVDYFALPGAVFYIMTTSNTAASDISTTTTTPSITTTASTATPVTPPTTSTPISPGTTPLGCAASVPLVVTVPDTGMSASTEYAGQNYKAKHGRLDHPSMCWTAKFLNLDQYLQVDFTNQIIATSVITQGDPNYPEWVTTYNILTSVDCATFLTMKDEVGNDLVFSGNTNNAGKVENAFVPVVTRCVRIHPVTWSRAISIRVEVMGCVF